VDLPGAYVYQVNGTAPCSNASATLTIQVRPAPDAGTNATTTVCSTDGSFALFTVLGGSPDAGGSWTAPGGAAHPGTFIPGTSLPGVYTYTVIGQAPCLPATATVTVTVNAAPNAGTNTAVTRCSNDASFSLFTQLGGTPNAGGTWTGPGGVHNGTFIPGTDLPGPYTYVVLGTAPCANASAVVTVSIVTAPNAGADSTVSVCSDDVPFALLDRLGGAPQATGTWAGPGGPSNGTFTPGTSPAGVYTYTVAGTAPCANALATVTVGVVQAPNAGTNGSVTVCSSEGPVDLFTLLGGGPAPGGTWTRPDGQAHSGTYVPGTQVGGNYTYTVAGTAPCANATAVVQVVRVIAPNAGTDGTITVCSTNAPFALVSVLGGSPNSGGSWLGPGNTPVGDTYTPGTSASGEYVYIVPGTSPCVNDSAFVTVNENPAPNAGVNASLTVCSSDDPFPLIDALGGTPDPAGTWTRPNGTPHSGTFDPGTSAPGGYTYTVTGLTPCLNATAVVVVSVNRQPVAGGDESFTRCSTSGPVDLFDELDGNPDAGGIWTGPSGVSSGIFIPGTSVPGTYSYVVTGTVPCLNDTAEVVANVDQAPNAGEDGDLTVCEGTVSVDLFDGLGGTPDLTGTWTDLDATGQISGNLFSPLGLPPGDYDFRYEVPANGPCPADIALVTVTIVAQLDAGSNGNLSVCGTSTQVNLFSGLGGSPQQGGVWLDLPGTGALTNQFFNATLVNAGTYTFRYRLQGILGCSSDSSQVNVTVVAPPNAGISGNTSTCSNADPFSLFQFLGGSPTPGGQWRRVSPTGMLFSGSYNPVLDNPGSFFYIVSGTSPCANAITSVTVTETPAPDAGTSRSITVCSNDAPFNMTDSLGGDPDPGTWGFGGQSRSAIFTPGLDIQGIYEYRVNGQFPCPAAQSSLTITVIPAADAGGNGSRTVCSDQAEFLLFTVLGGAPQFGGFWLGPQGPHDGSYLPGTDPPGDYLYIVEGEGPCANDTALVSIFENAFPDAGISNSAAYCSSTSPQVNLFTVLLGTPDAGGSWVGPAPANPPFSGVFTPGTSLEGLYTYSVAGVPPCTTRTATVNISVSGSASAGISNTITVCSNEPPFAMVDRLLGSPVSNGVWQGPLPLTTTMSGIFFPGITAPGTYRYTVPGVGQCAATSSTLSISVNPQPRAGDDAEAEVCETNGAFNLFPLLGPNAQVGGTWRRASDNAPHSGIILPSVDQSDTYIYRVNGQPPCTFDEASVAVTINASPEAGCNGLITVCNDQLPVALFGLLGCAPQVPGFWLNPLGALHSGVFSPGLDAAGIYAYVVAGSAPCVNDTALVTVIQNVAPDAGDNGAVVVCSDQANFALFTQLAGSPQPGGEWFDPSGVSFSGTYDPGSSEPGVYKYRIIAAAPCLSDSATVTVVENQAPNAGISGAAQICSSSSSVPLISWLGGTPDQGGSWTFNGDPHGPFFDPTTDISGPYLYTVAGNAPCSDTTAQVQVTLVPAVSAGTNGAVAACLDADAINLFAALGGSPNTGGAWVNLGNVGVLNGSNWNATGVPSGSYVFRYNVNGSGPCASASAEVTVTITPALDAGDDATVDACSGQLLVLSTALGGTPQSGGSWTDVDVSGALVGGDVFNTAVVPPGSQWRFDYVLPASAQCEADSARVTVNVLEGPYAGCDGGLNLCSNSAPLQLATGLNCGPDGGGTWFGPDLEPHGADLDPSTDLPGTYGYVVAAIGGCSADTAFVTVNITPAPNAGVNGSLAICSTDNATDMFPVLGPNAQTGGSWIYVTGGTGHGSIYNPVIDNPGVYQYTVIGQGTCSNASALVVVSEPQAPNAGCDATVGFCSSQAPILMRPLLGCSPQAGGTWVGPNGPHGNFFDPATDTPGEYTYVVVGTAPCANDSSTLSISVTTAANPGQNATLSACVSQTEVDLFAALGTNVTTGGTWTDVGGSGALTGNVFDPSVAGNGSWVFNYGFPANGPCAAVSAQVTVNVGSGSTAGSDNSVTVCGADCSFPLFDALGGTPDSGGSWTDQLGTGALLAGGLLNTCALPAGTVAPFTYTIVDAQCGNVQATVLVTVSPFPDPGGDVSIVLCATDTPLDLFDQLLGEPEEGGTWTDPNGSASTGVFVPGTSVPGPYNYLLPGNTTCPDTVSTVMITVNEPANAGANGELVVCDTLLALDLFQGLQGTPQTGGTWTDLDGSGALTNGFFNTAQAGVGEFTFRYTVVVPGCGSATALVKVDVRGSVIVSDIQRICNTADRTYTVRFTLSGGDTASYQVTGLPGTLSEAPDNIFVSDALITSASFEAFVQDQFACSVVRVAGDSPCDFEEAVFVPESFSPNGDGVNDAFVIPGIEGYPGNTIVIFNRWGGKVFEAAGYNNGSVVWDGSSPDALISGNSPAGTYFYVLELGDGQEALTGYIYLNR
jgi:gliding motility-associated-like protein